MKLWRQYPGAVQRGKLECSSQSICAGPAVRELFSVFRSSGFTRMLQCVANFSAPLEADPLASGSGMHMTGPGRSGQTHRAGP